MFAEAVSNDQRRAFPRAARASAAPLEPLSLDRFLTLHDVMDLTSLSRGTIYKLIGEGKFPKGIPIARQRVAWSARDLAKWQHQQRGAVAERDASMIAREDLAA
jgi:prophage regulatory protein